MSIDNGIYILETSGPEYRVVHACAIENIYDGKDEHGKWKYHPIQMMEYFDDTEVFLTEKEASEYALEMAKDIGYLEFGICYVKDFTSLEFKKVITEAYGQASKNPW